jgi:hypothetical protein
VSHDPKNMIHARPEQASAVDAVPAPSRGPMWCEDCDFDLPKLVPGARDCLGEAADVVLWTPGHTTNGLLNHPNMWNTDDGLTAFFAFTPRYPDRFYYTRDALVRCTFWEAVRDMWVHTGTMAIGRRRILDTEESYKHFARLMFHARGWGDPISDGTVAVIRADVRRILHNAAKALLAAKPSTAHSAVTNGMNANTSSAQVMREGER